MSEPTRDSSPTILIAEDEIIIATDLEGRLQRLGYIVCGKASQGEKAVALAERLRPDLVMMDIALHGDLDGISTAEIIRAKLGIPLVFLTAYADTDRLERAKLTYPFGYLMKPFQDKELKITVEMALYVAAVDAERKKTENALAKSEKHYRALFGSINEAVLVHEIYDDGTPGHFTDVNQLACQRLGYSREEMLRLTPADISTPQEFARLADYRKILANQANIVFETTHKTRDDRLIPVESSVAILYHDDTQTAISVSRDITERKRAEMALEKRLTALTRPLDQTGEVAFDDLFNLDDIQKLQDLFAESTGVASIITQTDGTPITAPSQFCRLCNDIIRNTELGRANCFKSDAALGRYHPDGPVVQPCLSGGLWDAGAAISVGGRHVANWLIGQVRDETQTEEKMRQYAREIGADEEVVVQAFREVPAMSVKRFRRVAQTLYVLANQLSNTAYQNVQQARFITDLKQAETEKDRLHKQLQQALKMEAVGILAGGIAHDFNNLLQAINGYTQLLLMDSPEHGPEYRSLKAIQNAGTRAAELVRQLLLFSRTVDTAKKPVALNREVEQARKILERTIPKMVDIEVHTDHRLWNIMADPVQIEQVVLNLGTNAADAMPDGGKLVIETKNVTLDDQYAQNHLGASPGKYVLLSVADNGLGMEKDIMEKIFDPFFTTKEIGKGTGLGLASVYGIVKGHGGHINCYSEVGQGTIFRIYLPALEQASPPEEKDLKTAPPQGGTETILIVDDEEPIRGFASQALRKFGYTVLTAANGEEALDIFADNLDRVDLVIMDLGMPGMGGRKCLRQIIGLNSSAKVLVASGYSAGGQAQKTMEAGASGFIGKPYQLTDLLHTVRVVLDKNARELP